MRKAGKSHVEYTVIIYNTKTTDITRQASRYLASWRQVRKRYGIIKTGYEKSDIRDSIKYQINIESIKDMQSTIIIIRSTARNRGPANVCEIVILFSV